MKKLVLALMMTLMLGSMVSTAIADGPLPTCFPCDEGVSTGN